MVWKMGSREAGQSVAEYALVATLVAVVSFGALLSFTQGLEARLPSWLDEIFGDNRLIASAAPGGGGASTVGGGSGGSPATGGGGLSTNFDFANPGMGGAAGTSVTTTGGVSSLGTTAGGTNLGISEPEPVYGPGYVDYGFGGSYIPDPTNYDGWTSPVVGTGGAAGGGTGGSNGSVGPDALVTADPDTTGTTQSMPTEPGNTPSGGVSIVSIETVGATGTNCSVLDPTCNGTKIVNPIETAGGNACQAGTCNSGSLLSGMALGGAAAGGSSGSASGSGNSTISEIGLGNILASGPNNPNPGFNPNDLSVMDPDVAGTTNIQCTPGDGSCPIVEIPGGSLAGPAPPRESVGGAAAGGMPSREGSGPVASTDPGPAETIVGQGSNPVQTVEPLPVTGGDPGSVSEPAVDPVPPSGSGANPPEGLYEPISGPDVILNPYGVDDMPILDGAFGGGLMM